MHWEELLRDYGYLAVLVGTFLEGESILVAAGFAASQGYLTLPGVVGAAFLGSFGGDQLFFFIGRRYGTQVLARMPTWQARIMRVHQLMQRWRSAFILAFRFLYGLRTVSPFVLGTSDVRLRQFFILNMIGAAVWAAAIGGSGYLFGEALGPHLTSLKKYSAYVPLGLLAVVLAVSGAVHLYQRSRRTQAPSPP